MRTRWRAVFISAAVNLAVCPLAQAVVPPSTTEQQGASITALGWVVYVLLVAILLAAWITVGMHLIGLTRELLKRHTAFRFGRPWEHYRGPTRRGKVKPSARSQDAWPGDEA